MAMAMRGAVDLPAPKALVWAKLNDPAVLKACIPACHTLEKISDTVFAASAKVRLGPLTATFKATILLSNIDAPHGYRISAEGAGGIAGFARGGADVTLVDTPGGTLMSYDVQAEVGGRIARLGSRLIGGVAKPTADTFFANFAALLQATTAPA